MNSRTVIGSALGVMGTLFTLTASAATYTISNTSFVELSGNNSLTMSLTAPGLSVSASDSSVILPQGANSLRTTLSGTIDTSMAGNFLSILSTSLAVAGNNGNWTPYGTPANAGAYFRLDLLFPGDELITAEAQVAIRNAQASLSGAATLLGGPGAYTFSTGGIAMTFVSGVADGYYTITGGGLTETDYDQTNLNDATTFPWQGTALQGSLVNDGVTETLTIPFMLVALDHSVESGPVDDVPGATLTLEESSNTTLTGQIVAVRPVPEPAEWMLLLAGLGLVGLATRTAGRAHRATHASS